MENKYLKGKKYCKVIHHCHYGEYRGAAHSIRDLKYSVPKKLFIVFYNGSRMIIILPISNFINNLSEGIHRVKYKFDDKNDKKCKTWGIKCKYCDCFFECIIFNGDLIEYKCLFCNKNYQQKFNEKLMERFFNTNKFSNYYNNKFILLL